MAPYYRAVWKLLGYQVDETLAKELEKKNRETLDEFEVKYKDAVENLGNQS